MAKVVVTEKPNVFLDPKNIGSGVLVITEDGNVAMTISVPASTECKSRKALLFLGIGYVTLPDEEFKVRILDSTVTLKND